VLQENYASFITACAPPELRPVRPGLTAVDGEILEVGSAPSAAPAIRPWDPARYWGRERLVGCRALEPCH
jgi:hypothetical protein